jgi:hypothetical protein
MFGKSPLLWDILSSKGMVFGKQDWFLFDSYQRSWTIVKEPVVEIIIENISREDTHKRDFDEREPFALFSAQYLS